MKVEPGETPLGTVAATVHPLSSGALTWITWPGETPVGTVTICLSKLAEINFVSLKLKKTHTLQKSIKQVCQE